VFAEYPTSTQFTRLVPAYPAWTRCSLKHTVLLYPGYELPFRTCTSRYPHTVSTIMFPGQVAIPCVSGSTPFSCRATRVRTTQSGKMPRSLKAFFTIFTLFGKEVILCPYLSYFLPFSISPGSPLWCPLPCAHTTLSFDALLMGLQCCQLPLWCIP